MNILGEIAERAKARVEAKKKTMPLEKLMKATQSVSIAADFPFEKALRSDGAGRSKSEKNTDLELSAHVSGIAFICEVKKASPSKGVIAADFPYLDIARAYEVAGAAAISVLTEPYYFQGDDRYLREIADHVSVPLLRKDFTVDRYMIYEAKLLGAGAVLLICAILHKDTLAEYIQIAHSLGLSALVEAHDETELQMALDAGARVVGVNNRDLKTFAVDTGNSARFRKLVPDDILFVSESGIRTGEDVAVLRRNRVDAVLVGEILMRSLDKKAALAKLRGMAP